MDIAEKLKEAEAKQQEAVTKMNLLAEEMNRNREIRQELLQEALKLEGEIRVLKSLSSTKVGGG